jgi:hypothetical protein
VEGFEKSRGPFEVHELAFSREEKTPAHGDADEEQNRRLHMGQDFGAGGGE